MPDYDDILCIYCNKPWSEKMLTLLGFADCSYTPECISAEFRNAIDIHCEHCQKLIYRKELDEIAEQYTQRAWN